MSVSGDLPASIDVTCPCGRVMHVKPEYLGKWVQCKDCKEPLLVQFDAPHVADEQEDELSVDFGEVLPEVVQAITEPEPTPPPPIPPPIPTPNKAVVPTIPEEPWYYSFIDGLAYLLLVPGLPLLGLMAFIGLMMTSEGEMRRFGVALLGLSFGLSVTFVLTSAWSYLAVDVARNIRVSRYR